MHKIKTQQSTYQNWIERKQNRIIIIHLKPSTTGFRLHSLSLVFSILQNETGSDRHELAIQRLNTKCPLNINRPPHTAAISDNRPKPALNVNHWTLNGDTLLLIMNNDTESQDDNIITQTSASLHLLTKIEHMYCKCRAYNMQFASAKTDTCHETEQLTNRVWGIIPKQLTINASIVLMGGWGGVFVASVPHTK